MQQDVVYTIHVDLHTCNVYAYSKDKQYQKYLSKESTLTFVNATVLMRLDYCNSIYTGLPQKTLYKLQLVQNAAASLITQHHGITTLARY